MTTREQTVLVVDDDRQLADLYDAWLTDAYDVRTAYGGEMAIESMDADVDVALIDRLMPDLSGDELLAHFQSEGYRCRVAMVTAVEPDFDIVEMGFDEYLIKPVQRDAITKVVDSLVTRSEYDGTIQELFAVTSKRAALLEKKDPKELESNEAYAELVAKFDRLRDDLDRTEERLTGRDLEIEMGRLGIDS